MILANPFFGKGIPLASGFDLGAKLPLDSRVSVDTYNDLLDHVSNNRVYPGMLVYVKDEDENYQYNGTEWVLFGRGSGDESIAKTVIVDKYEDIKNLTNVGQGSLIYVKKDSNKNNEENIYVVTQDKVVNEVYIPEVYVALSSFAKSLAPSLAYDSSIPEGKIIYLNREDEFTLRFNFSSDSYGDGQYKIYRNGALFRAINAPKGTVIVNLGAFEVNGTYTLEVTATDYFGVPVPDNNTLKYTVVVGGLELSSTFDQTLTSAIYEIGDAINVPFSATVADNTQKIKLEFTITKPKADGSPNGSIVKETLNTNTFDVDATWSNSQHFNTRGLYYLDIQAYTGNSVEDTTEGTFISNKLSYSFRVLASGEVGIISEYEPQIDTGIYASIPFKLMRKNTAYLTMRGKLEQKAADGSWKVYAETDSTGLTASCNVTFYWSVGRLPVGEYRYELWGYTTDFEQKSINAATAEFKVVQSSYKRVEPVTTNLLAWFDANDRRNADSDKNIWYNKKGYGLSESYRIELHDLNYSDNGWKHIDYEKGAQDNENGEFILKMNGQSWGQMVEVNLDQSTSPYSPFSIFTDKGRSGISIETCIRTRCNGDLDAKVITCMEGKGVGGPGVSIGFNKFYLRSLRQPLTMDFMEDEWVHVTFVVDREIRNLYGANAVTQENIEDLNQVQTMRIYINGVLCGCTTFADSDQFLDAANNAFPLMLNSCLVDGVVSNFADSEIKFIRIYDRPLKSSDVVQNYVSQFYDEKEQQAMKDRNDPSIVALPKIIFKRKLGSPNENNFGILHAITEKSVSKTTCVDCVMEFHEVSGKIHTIDNVDVYLQGTSSLQYPVKNYQIKKYDLPTGNANRKKEKFVVPTKENEWVDDHTYTLKVDYMEQSHMNNTPTAIFYDQIIDALGAQSPARKAGFRDSIDGFPCIVYYDDNPGGADSKEVLIGSFMFNIDKEGAELGFECKVTNDAGVEVENKCLSFEGTANTSDTAGCFFALDDNIEKVYKYYLEECYSKYVKDNKLNSNNYTYDTFYNEVQSGKIKTYQTFETYKKDYTEIDYIISDFEARYSYCEDDEEATYRPMLNLVNWVSSCWEKQANGEFALNRNKFESEFKEHFNFEYMLAYYLQMQVFAQVDNCGKNCMWDTWDEKIFYPRPYDMDTSNGLSNTGTEIIRCDAEIIPDLSPTKASGHVWAAITNSHNTTDDRYLMYNTKTSRLWNAFADVYADKIAETYIQLRNAKIYDVDNILKTVRGMTFDKIGEIYYNKDAASKYLQLTTSSSTELLQMLHGNRQQKYKKFLTERIIFLDTIYNYVWAEKVQENTLNSESRMRSDIAYDINTGKTETVQCHLGISVYSPQYVKVSVGSEKDAVIIAYVSPDSRYIDPNTGVEKEGTLISFPVAGTNKEIGVFGSGNIKRIDRLETLDLTSISMERLNKLLSVNLSGSTRLSVLALGQNYYLRELDCSRAQNLGTSDEGATLDLSNCKNLQYIDASVTKITGVNFPKNTNLITCNLSNTNITSVSIDGAEFLTDIRIANCMEITDFNLNRCNKLETLDISGSSVKNCKATDCANLKTVNVGNCSQLVSFDVSNSDMIEELIMTGNSGPVMRDLQLYSLYNLKRLLINQSSTLNTVRLPKHENLEEAAKGDAGRPWHKLEYLDISHSTIKKIQYGSSDVAGIICDMSKLINLTTLKCNDATAMTDMIDLNYTAVNGLQSLFENCHELRRITGKISTEHNNANSIFYRCHLLSDISGLTFDFSKNGNPCITTCNYAFFRCARATTAMVKKFLDACGSSLTSAVQLMYMWGLDINVSAGDCVFGTTADRQSRDIPDNLFEKTPNITDLSGAFLMTKYTNVPGTLLQPLKNALVNTSQMFCDCNDLVTVGKDLLKNQYKLTTVSGMFTKCEKLEYYLDSDPKIFEITEDKTKQSQVTTTNQMFYNCNKLRTGSNGLNGLFDSLVNATSFEFMFTNCNTNFAPTLQNGLFSKNTKLIRLDGLFYGCTKISSIPERLFRVNVADTNNITTIRYARNMFGGCTGLKGDLGRNFFAGAPNLEDIGYGCSTVELYSSGNNINATLGFFGNTNLSGYHEAFLSTVPKILNVSRFFYHNAANSSLKYCYYSGAGGADETYVNGISSKLFEKNTSLQNTSGMFTYNQSLAGHIPPDLFKPCKSSITNVSYMFQGCTGLNGINNDASESETRNVGISDQWFLNARNLTNAGGFLHGCTGFTSSTIPGTLFKGCTNLQYVHEFFYNCQGLNCEIPRGLLDDCRKSIRQVNSLFNNCRSLTGQIPVGSYSTTIGVIGYEQVAKEVAGALQVVVSPTNFNTQVSYEQVITTAPDLMGAITNNGSSYVKPIQGNITKTEEHGLFSSCTQLTTASSAFYYCEKLTGPVPYDLFYTDSASERFLNLTSVTQLFYRTGLNDVYKDVTGESYICNEDFFSKCPALTHVNQLFYRCTGFPSCKVFMNMFRNQSQITDASYLFFLTSAVTGDLTQVFLSSCLSKLQYANHMFCNTNLTSINPNFLNLGNKNTVLRRVGCIFHNCVNATGSSPEFWNTNMFPNIEKSEDGFHHALAKCTKLDNYAKASEQAEGAWVSEKSH